MFYNYEEVLLAIRLWTEWEWFDKVVFSNNSIESEK